MKQIRSVLFKAVLTSVLLFCFQTAVQAETGFLGMQVQVMPSSGSDALGREQKGGMLIRDVALDEPADQAGIHRGDLLIAIDEKSVGGMDSLLELLSGTKPGQTLNLTIIRSGKELILPLVLGVRGAHWDVRDQNVIRFPQNGLTLLSITPKIRKNFGLRWGTYGVLVSLADNDNNDEQSLIRGDVIVQVNQRNIWSPEQIFEMYRQALKEGRKTLLLLVERRDGFIFMTLNVKE